MAPEWWASIPRHRITAVDPDGEAEEADFDDSANAIVAAAPGPQVPAVVLTSDATPPEMIDEEHFPAWIRAHEPLADELGARHMTDTDSRHTMQVEQPALIATAIRDVLGQARDSRTSAVADRVTHCAWLLRSRP